MLVVICLHYETTARGPLKTDILIDLQILNSMHSSIAVLPIPKTIHEASPPQAENPPKRNLHTLVHT